MLSASKLNGMIAMKCLTFFYIIVSVSFVQWLADFASPFFHRLLGVRLCLCPFSHFYYLFMLVRFTSVHKIQPRIYCARGSGTDFSFFCLFLCTHFVFGRCFFLLSFMTIIAFSSDQKWWKRKREQKKKTKWKKRVVSLHIYTWRGKKLISLLLLAARISWP